MRAVTIIGILLIVAGLAGLAVRTFTYTTEEKVLDIGPIQATADKEHSIFVSPVFGIVAVVAGAALVVVGGRKKA